MISKNMSVSSLGFSNPSKNLSDGDVQKKKNNISTDLKTDPFRIEVPQSVDEENLSKAVESANEKLLFDQKRMEYSYHERTNTYMVKILDNKTGDVIKEIPSQKMLDMVADMWENFGLFVDEKI